MAKPIREDDDQDKPLDPAVENVRRKLLRFMMVNLALLGMALIAVVGAVVYKSRTPTSAPAATATLALPAEGQTIEGGIALPAGSRIVSQSLSGDRVSLHVEGQGGTQSIYIYDLAAGRMVGHFAIKAAN